MVAMDDQSVILGQDILRLARVVLVLHENYILFEENIETWGMMMVMRKKFGWVWCMTSLTLLKVFSDGDRPHIVTQPKVGMVSYRKDMGTVVGTLQVNGLCAKMKEDVGMLTYISHLLCALRMHKYTICDELGLASIVVAFVKCNGMFQNARSGT